MVCNEANLDLFHSLKQKIVVSEHNDLADVSLPLGPTSHLRFGQYISHKLPDISLDKQFKYFQI